MKIHSSTFDESRHLWLISGLEKMLVAEPNNLAVLPLVPVVVPGGRRGMTGARSAATRRFIRSVVGYIENVCNVGASFESIFAIS